MATTKAEYPSITIKSGNVVFISDIHFGWNASSEEWQENQRDYFENWFIPKVKALLEKLLGYPRSLTQPLMGMGRFNTGVAGE